MGEHRKPFPGRVGVCVTDTFDDDFDVFGK